MVVWVWIKLFNSIQCLQNVEWYRLCKLYPLVAMRCFVCIWYEIINVWRKKTYPLASRSLISMVQLIFIIIEMCILRLRITKSKIVFVSSVQQRLQSRLRSKVVKCQILVLSLLLLLLFWRCISFDVLFSIG